MATLLMVESWLHSTGLSLPPLIQKRGDRYVLLTKDPSLYPDTPDGAHPVIRDANEIVVADTNDARVAVQAATALAARRPIDGVITTCDYYLETAAAIADALGLPGPPREVMQVATRKHLVRAALQRAGLTNPAHAVAGDWPTTRAAAAEVGFPLVAKPVDLNSGTSVWRVDDEAALKDAFYDVTGIQRNTRGLPLNRLLLIEELLDGREVSVEAVTVDGVTTVIGITGKTVRRGTGFVEAGHVFPAPLDPRTARDVETLVRRALDAIGYRHGLSHTEVIVTTDGPRIVEINPRQGGGFIFDLVHLVTGTHPLEILVDLALGQPLRIGTALAPLTAAPSRVASAAVSFVMSPLDGALRGIDGTQRLGSDPHVHRWDIRTSGPVKRPRDNNSRLGHILAVDSHGNLAQTYADDAVRSLRLDLDGAGMVSPLSEDPGSAG